MHGELTGKRVAIYARFSSENQREASIDDQVRTATKLVAERGGSVDRALVFTDSAVSGSTMERPGLRRLLDAISQKRVDVLIVEDASRLSRDGGHSAEILKRCRFYGVRLITSDGIDTARAGSKLEYGLKSLMGEAYIDDLRLRTLRGLEGRALAGHATGGLAYGYRSVAALNAHGRVIGHEIAIEESQAKAVRRIFELYARGNSCRAIVQALNDDGVATPRVHRSQHKGWAPSAIRAMLLNPRYRGHWPFGERVWMRAPDTGRRQPRKREGGPLVTQQRDDLRIVTEALWEQVQARFESRKHSETKPARRSYLFSGLLVCGVCGSPMTIHGGDETRRYYRCSANSQRRACENNLSVLESVTRTCLLDAIRRRLQTPGGIAEIRDLREKYARAAQRSGDGDLATRRAELAQVERRLNNLVSAIAEGNHSSAVQSALNEHEATARKLRTAITNMERLVQPASRQPVGLVVLESVLDLDHRLTRDIEQGRATLRRYLRGGNIALKPTGEGTYTAHCDLLPAVILEAETETPSTRDGVYLRLVAGACKQGSRLTIRSSNHSMSDWIGSHDHQLKLWASVVRRSTMVSLRMLSWLSTTKIQVLPCENSGIMTTWIPTGISDQTAARVPSTMVLTSSGWVKAPGTSAWILARHFTTATSEPACQSSREALIVAKSFSM